jgi:anthranilate phosphoribosyltransferase
LIGVFAPRLTTLFAEVLQRLGRTRVWVVHGLADKTSGMDDVSVSGATTVAEFEHDRITSAVLDTQWLGLGHWSVEELFGGDRKANAAIITGILSGEVKGAKRDMTLANAAAGFLVSGLVQNMNHGIELAREQIDSGRALAKLRAMQSFRPD